MDIQELIQLPDRMQRMEAMLQEILNNQKANYQKKLSLTAGEAKVYLNCSYATLHNIVKRMQVEKTVEGYNAYDVQQVHDNKKDYRYFLHRPKDWQEAVKPITILTNL
jgi:hypothetical protein